MKSETNSILADLVARYPVLSGLAPELGAAAATVGQSLAAGGTLFTAGNGGSAADAEHIVGELLKGFLRRRPLSAALRQRFIDACGVEEGGYLGGKLQGGLRAVALTGHPALATAVGNDTAGDMIFAQQLFALARPGDVFLALSTSGNARNVVLAARVARVIGVHSIAFTGAGGGRLATVCDRSLRVPATETHKVQELQVPVYHALCALLEAAVYPE